MQRTKVLAVSAALVSAAVAAILFTGGASAASWYVYEGDMFAGHAYGLQVPADAESVEFGFAGTGSAAIGVYAPDGEKLGFYELTPDLTAASIANPGAGQHVVYVYDVVDGALSVRVNADEKPALELDSIDLLRDEIAIGTFEQGRLDQTITQKLAEDPVFVTLLYEGSARMLDATVSTEKGAVVSIVDESATAFSPGVWTTMKGERTFDAENLVGNVVTVEVHAEQFEGTMVLATLALDLPAPTPEGGVPMVPPVPPTHPEHPEHPSATRPTPVARPIVEDAPGVFGLHTGAAVAFEAPAGATLQLVDPTQLEREAAEEQGEEWTYEDDCQPMHALVAIYAPDDSVLAVVELTHEKPVVEIELPVAGEYVAYTHFAEEEIVLAAIAGATTMPQLRELAIEEIAFDLASNAFLGGEAQTVDLERVPLTMDLRFTEGLGALASAYVENENGMVAGTDAPLVMPGSEATPFQMGWGYQDIARFAAGEHAITTSGLYEGSLRLVVTSYVRESVASPEHDHAHDHEHDDHDEHEHGDESAAAPLPLAGVVDVVTTVRGLGL